MLSPNIRDRSVLPGGHLAMRSLRIAGGAIGELEAHSRSKRAPDNNDVVAESALKCVRRSNGVRAVVLRGGN